MKLPDSLGAVFHFKRDILLVLISEEDRVEEINLKILLLAR